MITNNPLAISHANPGIEGITCKQNEQGSFDVTLPASLSSTTQADIDQWEADYNPLITVSAWQFRKAVNQLNLRNSIETAVTASTDQNLKDGWEYAIEFKSNDPLVLSMGAAIGKSEDEVYQVFQSAETK